MTQDTDSGVITPVNLPSGAVLIASHPDGEHMAVVESTGRILLAAASSGENAELLTLQSREQVLRIEFLTGGRRLWLPTDVSGVPRVLSIDLSSIASHLDFPPVSPLIEMSPEPLGADHGVGLSHRRPVVGHAPIGRERWSRGFGHHRNSSPSITFGLGCRYTRNMRGLQLGLFVNGLLLADDIPGAAVGFFVGGVSPIFATTTSGTGCGERSLWVTTGLPGLDMLSTLW